MDKDYRSLEHKIRDVVEASMNRNTDLRRKVVNVGRPDTAPSNFDPKSKLAKQGEIKTKIIDEAKDKENDEDKNKKADADADDKDDKKKSKSGDAKKPEDQMSGGKTEVDLEPKTDDKVVVDSDDKPKKTKKVTKEETMLRSDNKFGLPQDLIDAVTEALKGGQKKLDKNHNGKLDGQDFKILRGDTKAKAKPEHDKARPAFTAKEEVEIDEAVKTGNEGHGYHGEAHHAAKGEDKMAEAGKAYAKAHSLVKKHAADHLKNAKNPNVMVKHYLDSKHGRHLYGNENNAAYVKKDFGHFAKKYDAKMHEEVEQLDELSNKTLQSYKSKSENEIGDAAKKIRGKAKNTVDAKKVYNRFKGIQLASKKLNKEEVEQIDEISARKAMDYSIKSAANVGSGKSGDKEDKRIAGQKMADEKYRKMQGKSSSAKIAATEETQIDEVSDDKLSAYRQAAKGKDREAGRDLALHKMMGDVRAKVPATSNKPKFGINKRGNFVMRKEDVELSDAEIARLEEIAKDL